MVEVDGPVGFRRGVRLQLKAGADLIKVLPPYSREEIERFVEHGYTPMEVIVAATKINAEVCGASDWLGTIEKGKIADLLVISGDPLKDIRALRKDKIIVRGGKVIKH